MGTKNNPGRYDCYKSADPDEPMFILLGRDEDAPAVVWEWIWHREIREGRSLKVIEAIKCCKDLIKWLFKLGRFPRLPAGDVKYVYGFGEVVGEARAEFYQENKPT